MDIYEILLLGGVSLFMYLFYYIVDETNLVYDHSEGQESSKQGNTGQSGAQIERRMYYNPREESAKSSTVDTAGPSEPATPPKEDTEKSTASRSSSDEKYDSLRDSGGIREKYRPSERA